MWICAHADGHLQATGRDARGRKQYRYHPQWIEIRDQIKYGRILDFARVLPAVRRQVRKDLAAPTLSRQRVLAIVVTLLERTLIRVGNEEYARTNGSFGLTTLRDRHAQVNGRRVRFRFRGKSGVFQQVDLDDPQLAKSVRRCQELPGQTLFQYIDADGARQAIDSADVNEYLRALTGGDFTAKDFRTWSGSVLAASALAALARVESATARKKTLVRAIEAVAQRLGNTKAVCRKCYIHPAILDAYLDDGETVQRIRHNGSALVRNGTRLSNDEKAVVALLTRRLRPTRRRSRVPNARSSRAGYPATRASAAAP